MIGHIFRKVSTLLSSHSYCWKDDVAVQRLSWKTNQEKQWGWALATIVMISFALAIGLSTDSLATVDDNNTKATATELAIEQVGLFSLNASDDSYDWIKCYFSSSGTMYMSVEVLAGCDASKLVWIIYDDSGDPGTIMDFGTVASKPESDRISISQGWYYLHVDYSGGQAENDWYRPTFHFEEAIDTNPPRPNPSEWFIEPYPLSSGSIRMSCSPGYDPEGNTPITYFFQFVEGSGGHDSGWISDPLFDDQNLEPNKSYGYECRAKDSKSNETIPANKRSCYTFAEVPPAPEVENGTSSSLDVIPSVGINPVTTRLAIYNKTKGYYLATNGSNNGSTPVWQSQYEWGIVTNTGLDANTTYAYQVKAKNEDEIETDLGDVGSGTTIEGSPEQYKWLDISDKGNVFEVWTTVNSGESIPNVRPLDQTIDEARLTGIYLKDLNGEPLNLQDALRLLVLTQSAKKYQAVPRDWALDSSDFELDERDDYTVFPPYATSDWWRWMFIYSNFYNIGLDDQDARKEYYSDVVLDAVLQPDVANNLWDEDRVMQGLSNILSLTSDAIINELDLTPLEEAEVDTLIDVATNPNSEIDLAAFMDLTQRVALILSDPNVCQALKLSKKAGSYFGKLNTALGGLVDLYSGGKKIQASICRQQFLQSLSGADAEERLLSVEAFSNRWGTSDLTFSAGVAQARQRFDQYQSEFYTTLPGIIRAGLENDAFMDFASFGSQMAALLGNKAAGKVLLPYALSWEVHKLIREQINNARYATLGSTIVMGLDGPDGITALNSVVESGGVVDSEETLMAVRLLEVYYYLGYYSYARTLDTLNNSITAAGGWLLPGDDYETYMGEMRDRSDDSLARLNLISPTAFLTRHRDPYNLVASDDENSWLMGLLQDYLPEEDPPEVVAAFSIVGNRSGLAPLTVELENGSIGGTEWEWVFGDGTTTTVQNLTPNITHVYSEHGIYNVQLIARNESAVDVSTSKEVIVTVDPPLASFTATNTIGHVPLSVGFTDDSTGVIDHWEWIFGDGETSTERNPVHLYNEPGTYTVCLHVSGPGGTTFTIHNDLVVAAGSVGDLTVQCNIPQAMFQLTGPRFLTGSGETSIFNGIPAGTYRIDYVPLAGFNVPPSEEKVLEAGGSVLFICNYVDAHEDADLNNDGLVDLFDLVYVSQYFGRAAADGFTPVWNSVGDMSNPDKSDLNGSGEVDVFDLVIVSNAFSQ